MKASPKKKKPISKATRVRRSLTILQRNVNFLLSEFKKMDALDAKIAKASKTLISKRKK